MSSAEINTSNSTPGEPVWGILPDGFSFDRPTTPSQGSHAVEGQDRLLDVTNDAITSSTTYEPASPYKVGDASYFGIGERVVYSPDGQPRIASPEKIDPESGQPIYKIENKEPLMKAKGKNPTLNPATKKELRVTKHVLHAKHKAEEANALARRIEITFNEIISPEKLGVRMPNAERAKPEKDRKSLKAIPLFDVAGNYVDPDAGNEQGGQPQKLRTFEQLTFPEKVNLYLSRVDLTRRQRANVKKQYGIFVDATRKCQEYLAIVRNGGHKHHDGHSSHTSHETPDTDLDTSSMTSEEMVEAASNGRGFVESLGNQYVDRINQLIDHYEPGNNWQGLLDYAEQHKDSDALPPQVYRYLLILAENLRRQAESSSQPQPNQNSWPAPDPNTVAQPITPTNSRSRAGRPAPSGRTHPQRASSSPEASPASDPVAKAADAAKAMLDPVRQAQTPTAAPENRPDEVLTPEELGYQNARNEFLATNPNEEVRRQLDQLVKTDASSTQVSLAVKRFRFSGMLTPELAAALEALAKLREAEGN